MATNAAQPFALSFGTSHGVLGSLNRAIARIGECLLSLHKLNDIYAGLPTGADLPFSSRVLRALDVTIRVNEADLRAIPTHGPLVVVANHPAGGLDGLILADLLHRVRPDAKLLANDLLSRIPEMSESCIFVDPFGGKAANRRNRAGMRSAARWVGGGGALGIFPAGEVSHFTLRRGCVSDPEWFDAAARIALRTKATVVPVFFHGTNSPLFQVLGLVHPRLRTATLPRELLRRRGQDVQVEIGTPILPARLARFRELPGPQNPSLKNSAAAAATEYLRLRTYILKGRTAPRPRAALGSAAPRTPQPISAAILCDLLKSEIDALSADQCLASSGSLRVFCGSAAELPRIVREIGRLRELTFRQVGEGTGREIDLDRFDDHYLHLFVWDAAANRVVGAYRLGQTDSILPHFGADGLYTSTLFQYRKRLLEQISPALELGRSFVIRECQRDYAPLLLLWKGIGQFVARHPRYCRLFGAVSISDDFQTMTKQLLMAFLRAHSFDRLLASSVRAKRPPRAQPFKHLNRARLATLVDSIADVEELVGEIESNRRNVPVLLRQYLRLNAKLLGFNIDRDFGDVVDGLVLVDLRTVVPAILNRYLGKEGAAKFVAHHAAPPSGSLRNFS